MRIASREFDVWSWRTLVERAWPRLFLSQWKRYGIKQDPYISPVATRRWIKSRMSYCPSVMKNLIFTRCRNYNYGPKPRFQHRSYTSVEEKDRLTDRKKGKGHLDNGDVVSNEGRGDSGDIQLELGYQSNNFVCWLTNGGPIFRMWVSAWTA